MKIHLFFAFVALTARYPSEPRINFSEGGTELGNVREKRSNTSMRQKICARSTILLSKTTFSASSRAKTASTLSKNFTAVFLNPFFGSSKPIWKASKSYLSTALNKEFFYGKNYTHIASFCAFCQNFARSRRWSAYYQSISAASAVPCFEMDGGPWLS